METLDVYEIVCSLVALATGGWLWGWIVGACIDAIERDD